MKLTKKGGIAGLPSFKGGRPFNEGDVEVKVAVLGATGYAGCELVRLLSGHPEVEIVFASSESHAGKAFDLVNPQFYRAFGLELQPLSLSSIPDSVDLVFCALPHGRPAGLVPRLLQAGKRVIDLSADFRLRDPALYEIWYDRTHPAPEFLGESIYGLPEINREAIAGATLIANPGCFPTAVLLALAPLAGTGLVDWDSVIVDAKTGISGAGRSPRRDLHFPECVENLKAYRVGCHQHTPEIEQLLSSLSGESVTIAFTPHLIPMARGIFCTVYLRLRSGFSPDQLDVAFRRFYDGHPFVRVLPPPRLPETKLVRGSNYCDLGIGHDRRTGRVLILSAIDNLVKGAAGQAVQNMNIMYGLPETRGLEQLPLC